MRITAAGRTDTGPVRPANEDAFLCGETVFAVADGLGGLPAGEVASRLAVDAVAALDGRVTGGLQAAREALAECVAHANQAVLIDARAHPAHVGMATTLTVALVHEGHLLLAHVGDSRGYLLRAGGLRQLTDDHNPPGQPSVLTRVVGHHETRPDQPEPVELAPGDRVLLCTDGLSGVLEPARLGELLGTGDPELACEALVHAAVEAGADDNVTAVVMLATGP